MAASTTNARADPSMIFVGNDNDEAPSAVALKRQD